MKFIKYSLSILVVLGVVWFLFQKQIYATVMYVAAVTLLHPEGEVQIPSMYQLQPGAADTVEHIVVDNIVVPVTFIPDSNVVDVGYGMASGNEKNLTIFNNTYSLLDVVVSNNLKPEERAAVCSALMQASGVSACDSEFAFFKAIQYTDPGNTNLYSSMQQKIGVYMLWPLRYADSSYLHPVKEFFTDDLRGFIRHKSDVVEVELFTQSNRQYSLTLIGYSEEEIDYTIDNIRVR